MREYVDISSRADAAMGRLGQIAERRQNGFDLEQKRPWKGNQPSLRPLPPDLFAILAPRRRGLWVYGLALLWQKSDFWDSLCGGCVIHEEPALVEAGDGR
ncbi:hypothetical protein, partial [Novosphingobium sp. SCN 63-17]|uniref:hypothetical protein n=3 Tax=Novosphingobium TaxID=165696 RepID=UPI0025FB4D5C